MYLNQIVLSELQMYFKYGNLQPILGRNLLLLYMKLTLVSFNSASNINIYGCYRYTTNKEH